MPETSLKPGPDQPEQPSAGTSPQENLANAALPTAPLFTRAERAGFGAIGLLSLGAFVFGVTEQNRHVESNIAARNSGTVINPEWRQVLQDARANSHSSDAMLEITQGSQYQLRFIEATRDLIRKIPCLERYNRPIANSDVHLKVSDTAAINRERYGIEEGESLPPAGLYLEHGDVHVSDTLIADAALRALQRMSPMTLSRNGFEHSVHGAAFEMLATTLHEIGHKLHDESSEHSTSTPHLFNTLEEEVAVELEAALDCEHARRFVLSNPEQFHPAAVRAAIHLPDISLGVNRPDFENNFAALYPRLFSINSPRPEILEVWKYVEGVNENENRELEGTREILGDDAKFETLKTGINARLESVRNRWDREVPDLHRTAKDFSVKFPARLSR